MSPPVRRALERTGRSSTAPYREVQRARIVLLAAKGLKNEEIAKEAGCTVRTVRKWRSRFVEDPTERALEDRRRSGRPARIRPEDRCEVIKLACDRPPDCSLRDTWTYEALSAAIGEAIGVSISVSEIGRILRAKELRPHRMRMWLHSPDPDFTKKVKTICRLYIEPPKDAVVLCIDEKTGVQAIERKHATRHAAPGREGRREFEYVRHGTRTVVAALDVSTGQVFAQCRKRRTAKDLVQFMETLARRYPDREIYVIWDNLNIHFDGKQNRWTRFNERHGNRFHFVYTPLHASWVNQIELWFSILQRRVIKNGSFESAEQLSWRVRSFISQWNRNEAHPFRWTFRGTCKKTRKRRAA